MTGQKGGYTVSINSISEDCLAASVHYSETMESVILPWLEQHETVSEVAGFDGRPLHCVTCNAENPSGTVLIVHGFTENTCKYSELIYSLVHNGFSVVAYDQRGHGRSWRDPGIQDLSVTHVNRFSDYVQDLKCVCDALLPGMPSPYYLFAHSMGGAVSALFLENYPDIFSGAVLSAPMIAPNLSGVPAFAASSLARLACMFGKGKKHPFFMKTYSGPEDFQTSCATDPERFSWYDRIKAGEKLYHNSVPSYRWSLESIRVTSQILRKGEPEKISCPILLFSAEKDFSVLPEPQEAFIARVKNGKLARVSGARHEIYRSTDNILYPWWHHVLDFYRTPAEERGVQP